MKKRNYYPVQLNSFSFKKHLAKIALTAFVVLWAFIAHTQTIQTAIETDSEPLTQMVRPKQSQVPPQNALLAPPPSPCEVPTTLSQTTTQNIIPFNTLACVWVVDGETVRSHTANSYWRVFNLTDPFIVSAVEVGIGRAITTSGSQPITIKLYQHTGAAFPGGTLTPIATANYALADQVLTIVSIPIAATLTVFTEVVVEVSMPDGFANRDVLFLGSNSDGQSATGYWSSVCGNAIPTAMAATSHLVLNMVGTQTAHPILGTPSVTDASCNSYADGKAVVSATCGTGAITYSISPNVGTQSPAGTFTGLTAQTYTVTATDANSKTGTTIVTISEPPIIVVTQFSPTSSTQCVGTTVTYTAAATGVNMTVKWQKNNVDVTAPVPYASGTTASFTTPPLLASDNGATYRAVFEDGCPNDKIATAIGTITMNTPSVGGTLSPAQSQGCGPQTVNLSVSGINGAVTQWERQSNCTGNWVSIGSPNSSAITTTTPNLTSCYRVKVTNGVCPAAYSTTSTVTVDKPAVGGSVTLQSNQNAVSIALCPSQNAVLIPKGSVGKVVKWQYSFNTLTNWNDLPGTQGQTTLTVNGSTVSGTVYYRVVITTDLGLCTGAASVAYSSAFKITKKANCVSPDGSIVNNGIQTNPHLTIQKIYPNPASNYINLEMENVTASGVSQIDILDITGRQVLKQTLNLIEGFNSISLDISQLSRGVFIVKMTDSQNQKAWVKMVKE